MPDLTPISAALDAAISDADDALAATAALDRFSDSLDIVVPDHTLRDTTRTINDALESLRAHLHTAHSAGFEAADTLDTPW